MSDEFPPSLIDRCVQAHSEVVANHGLPGYRLSAADVITVLRSSGHAKLVAALEDCEKVRDEWCEEYTKVRNVNADLVAALKSFVDWAEAYPIDIFPEPDLKRSHELLKAGGISLDAISANIMRKMVGRIGEHARATLKAAGEK